MGGIQVAVKKTDVKRSKFTVDVIADDRIIEKKDSTATSRFNSTASQKHGSRMSS